MEAQQLKEGLPDVFPWDIWDNGDSALGKCLDEDGGVWRGWFLQLPFCANPHSQDPWDPKIRDCSRCNPATLIMIIAPGAVILIFFCFSACSYLFIPPCCSSLCLDGCGEHSVPLSCDFREILLDVQKQRGWGFCSPSFFWSVCISLHAALWALHSLGSSRDSKEYCFGLQTLCNVRSSLCNSFKI